MLASCIWILYHLIYPSLLATHIEIRTTIPLKLKISNSYCTIIASVFFPLVIFIHIKKSKAFIISVHNFNMQINGEHFHDIAIAIAWTKQIIIRKWLDLKEWWKRNGMHSVYMHVIHANTRLYFHWFYSLCWLLYYIDSWIEKWEKSK